MKERELNGLDKEYVKKQQNVVSLLRAQLTEARRLEAPAEQLELLAREIKHVLDKIKAVTKGGMI